MPSSPAVLMMVRADSAPWRWPSTRGRWRCFAQRPLPSMMMATCWGRVAFASALRLMAGALICSGAVSAPSPAVIDRRYNLNKNGLVAAWPDGRDVKLRAGQFRDGLGVGAGLGRKVLPRLALVGRRFPAFEVGVDRFAFRQNLHVVRHVIVAFLAVPIRDANLDRLDCVEAVEVCDGEVVDAVDHRGVAR